MKNEIKSSKIRWVQAIFDQIADAKWTKIGKVYLVSCLFLATGLFMLFTYNIVRDKDAALEAIEKIYNEKKQEEVDESLRETIITPRIQEELYDLVHIVNADRAFVFELHNGKKNTSGLPFRFADMSYEVPNDVKKAYGVAMEFQDVPLTLYKYPHYMQKEKLFIGTVDEIAEIDPEFANQIKNIGGEYMGFIYMSSRGIPLGFIGVSWHDVNDVPDKEIVETNLKKYDMLLSNLLDLSTHM